MPRNKGVHPNAREVRDALMAQFGFSYDHAGNMLRYTAEDKKRPSKEWKTNDGFVTIRYHGLSQFTLEDHTGNPPANRVVIAPHMGYATDSDPIRKGKDGTMPARARGRQPAPEPESNGQVDYQAYVEKPLSATMTDYAMWFRENVGDPDQIDSDRLLALGSSLYPHFQRSDFNQERREARRAAREAPAEAEPAPAASGRGKGRTARGAASAPPASAPARGGRSRGGRQRAAATPEAAY